MRVRLSPLRRDGDELALRVTVADTTGAPVLTAESLTMRAADPARLRTRGEADGLYALEWTPLPTTGSAPPRLAELTSDGSAPVAPGAEPYADLDAVEAAGMVPPVVLARVGTGGDPLDVVEAALALRAGLARRGPRSPTRGSRS